MSSALTQIGDNGTLDGKLGIYYDLPTYKRSSDEWYMSHGSDLACIMPMSLWDKLVMDFNRFGGTKEIFGVLAGYDIDPKTVAITDYGIVKRRGTSDSVRVKPNEVFGLMNSLVGYLSQLEIQMGLRLHKKRIMGFVHNHPNPLTTQLSNDDAIFTWVYHVNFSGRHKNVASHLGVYENFSGVTEGLLDLVIGTSGRPITDTASVPASISKVGGVNHYVKEFPVTLFVKEDIRDIPLPKD